MPAAVHSRTRGVSSALSHSGRLGAGHSGHDGDEHEQTDTYANLTPLTSSAMLSMW